MSGDHSREGVSQSFRDALVWANDTSVTPEQPFVQAFRRLSSGDRRDDASCVRRRRGMYVALVRRKRLRSARPLNADGTVRRVALGGTVSTPKRSTLVGVAKLAGVSIASVSRVLNGLATSPDVKRRVEAAAAELDYVPDTVARSLKLGRTEQIAFAVADVGNPVYVSMMHAVENVVSSVRLPTRDLVDRHRPRRPARTRPQRQPRLRRRADPRARCASPTS